MRIGLCVLSIDETHRLRRKSFLADFLKAVVISVLTDSVTLLLPGKLVVPEVDPSKYASVRNIVGDRSQIGIHSHDPRCSRV